MTNENTSNRIDQKVNLMDKKLKESFKTMKKDITWLKDKLEKSEFDKQKEVKVKEVSSDLDLKKYIENLNLKLDKQELELEKEKHSFQLQLERERNKQALQKEKSKTRFSFAKLKQNFNEKAQLRKLKKEYENQLAVISKTYEVSQNNLLKQAKENTKLIKIIENNRKKDFEKSLVEKNQLFEVYELKLKNLENNNKQFQNQLLAKIEGNNNLMKEIGVQRNKDFDKFLKEKNELTEIYELKLKQSQANSQNFQKEMLDRMTLLNKSFSNNLRESNKKFERTLQKLEEKRQEDNLLILKQLAQRNNNDFNNKEKNKFENVKQVNQSGQESWFDVIKQKFSSFNSSSSDSSSEVKPELKLNYKLETKSTKEEARKVQDAKIVQKKSQHTGMFWKIIPYVFLLVLAILAVNQYFKWSFITDWNWQIVTLGIFAGGLTFWKNRDRVEQEIEQEKNQEELQEEIRKKEFGFRFPTINKIPILRSIVKWMYKEGWAYSIGLIVICLIYLFFLIHGLGSFDLREDEFQVMDTAVGLLNTHTSYKWDWLNNSLCNPLLLDSCHYTRAFPHTFLVYVSYLIFGVSEWSSRIVSVLFGLIFLFVSYFIIKFFSENKKIAIVSVGTFSLYIEYFNIFRYTRMYAFLIPLFLILYFLIFKLLINNKEGATKLKYRLGGFRVDYIICLLLVGILSALVHINSLVILPITVLFIFYLTVAYKEKRYILLSVFGVISFLLVLLVANYTNYLESILNLLSFFERSNLSYVGYLLNYPLGLCIALILLVLGLFPVFFFKVGDSRDKRVYLYFAVIFSLIFFVYIADRYSGFLYVSYLTSISICLILMSGEVLTKIYSNYVKRTILIILLILLFSNFIPTYTSIQNNENDYGDFSEAYQIVLNNYNLNETIFGQYLRGYYLQGLDSPKTIDMLKNGLYPFNQFLADINSSKQGWIIWESRKGYHLQKDIKNYISKNFEHLHGEGIDATKVEIYYFNQSMIN